MNTARLAAAALLLSTSAAFAQDPVIVGLITKTETNPFFVKMRAGAQAQLGRPKAQNTSAPKPRSST